MRPMKLAALVAALFVAPSAMAQSADITPSTSGTAETTPAPASASGGFGSSANFGRRMSLVISTDTNFQLGYANVGGNGGFLLNLHPAADFFVVDHVSVGGGIGLNFISASGTSHTTFTIGPRAGYAIPVTPMVSIWPRAGFFYATDASAFGGGIVVPGTASSGLGLNFDAPVIFHVADHFFVGIGPSISAQLTGDVKETSVLLQFTLGGSVGPFGG